MIEHLYEDLSVHLYEGEPITKKAPTPLPITYLTQWKIVGNSEVHDNEIWSCGEYNATDGKYHILVQPLGGNIADIALTEPLRKVNDVADTIEFPSSTDGKALVTRNLGGDKLGNFTWDVASTYKSSLLIRWATKALRGVISASSVILTIEYTKGNTWSRVNKSYSYDFYYFYIYDEDYNTEDSYNDFIAHINNYGIIYKFVTPTTELVDAPQIAEAESYSCVISQGAKAVEWSSFNGGILEFYDKITPTDNAYINTGYIPTVNSKFVTHIKRAGLNNCCIYSNAAEGKTDGIRFLLSGRNFYVSFGAPRKVNNGLSDLELNIAHAHEQYITINGNSDTYITSVGDRYINEPLTIFSDYQNRATSGTMAYFNGNSLYSFKIYENDVLVRDFKPCTYNGVAGLWDMVESKFYGNSNNVGTLTASNDA